MESEFDLISALRERLPSAGDGVLLGSGDDAAVTEGGDRPTATTVDAIVEGVHFTLPAFPPRAVGRKALAASLSDLAAMAAEPGEAYVVLGIPEGTPDDLLLELADGLAEVAEREGVSVVGGDVTRSPALVVAVTCVGREPREGRLVTRSGAQVGDAVVVTGELGGAAAALELLASRDGAEVAAPNETREALLARQLDPQPRIAAGLALSASGASAMIDVSDGVGADGRNLARASGARVEIEAHLVPVARGLRELGRSEERALATAISGGEDFELLATMPPERLDESRAAVGDYGLTQIGRVVAPVEGQDAVSVLALDGRELEPGGFDHMRGSRSG
jgi:thiamine-monophosphate kinase